MAACPPCSSEADLKNWFGPDLLVVRGSAWTSKGLDFNRGHIDDPGRSLDNGTWSRPWGDVSGSEPASEHNVEPRRTSPTEEQAARRSYA
ncbi:unnamed protein product [Gadus morhua 'NCC']